jgi:hypothetical protein
VDTNVLVDRFDPRESRKQGVAERLLREGIRQNEIRIAHRAIVEFVSACTRQLPGGLLLDPPDARREAEELLSLFSAIDSTGACEPSIRSAESGELGGG